MSSLNYPFNYGLGYYGCAGQSAQNCPNDFSNCCFQYAGPYLTPKLNTSTVVFSSMNSAQKASWINRGNSVKKSKPVANLHKIPLEFSGVV